MATISATVTQGGNPDASKTYTISDADMNKVIAAYQSEANISVNGTATRVQVLNYMFNTIIVTTLQGKVQAHETVPAVTPPVIPIT